MTSASLDRFIQYRLWAWMLLVCVAVAACGTGERSPATPSPGEPTATAAFPVRIEHKFGTTEILEAPERVVTVGYNDHDAVLALGVTPVGVRDWFGDQPYAVWPWAQEQLGDAQPEVLPSEALNFEQIAGLRPDLIIGVYSGMAQEEYATLSEIAPTIAQSDEFIDFGVPWQEQTRVVGQALGRTEQAEELVAELEARFAEAREEHPEFEDATGVIALTGEGGNYYPYGLQDGRARFLTSLGFQLPTQVAELAGDEFFATISHEQLELVDADLLIWIVNTPAEGEALANDPIYQQLDASTQGRDLFLNISQPLGGALAFSTVPSLSFALDELVPQIAAAVDGDPSTEPATGS